MGQVVGYLTLLAVFIAALGLVGLSAFTAARRQKEICIRKVHGASIPGVLGLVSKGYFALLLVSFVLAAPIAYFAMRQWLQNFAYHTTIGADVFVGGGVLAILVAALSIGYQSLRVVRSNPAEVLRHE